MKESSSWLCLLTKSTRLVLEISISCTVVKARSLACETNWKKKKKKRKKTCTDRWLARPASEHGRKFGTLHLSASVKPLYNE